MSDLLTRPIGWLVRKVGLETLFYLSGLLLILWASLTSMQQIVRSFDSGVMAASGLGGLLCGWLLARSRLRTSRALPAGLALGIGWVFWQVGRLSLPAWQSLLESSRYFLDWLAWRPGLPLPPSSGLAAALGEFGAGLSVLAERVFSWIISAAGGAPQFDPLAATIVWGLSLWLANGWAGWAMRRWRKPLWAVTPSAGLIGISLAAVSGPTFSLLVLLAASLAMLGWNSYSQQEKHWTLRQIDFPEDLRLDTALALIAVILSLTSIAASSPSISIDRLTEWGDRLSTAWGPANRPAGLEGASQGSAAGDESGSGLTFGESLGLAPGSQVSEQSALDDLRYSGGLPQERLLGAGPELSEELVLAARDETPPELPAQVRYYWRAVTYDRYSGVGWATGPTQEVDYPANERTQAGGLTAQVLVRQEIQVIGEAFGGGTILFSPGELLAANQAYQVAWRRLPGVSQDEGADGSGGADGSRGADDSASGGDQYGALSRPAGRALDSYRIEALVSQASQGQLRSAGSRYPDWVLANGLFLPDSLPSRVRRLALDLTATEPNPYDRAVAIEAYLRKYPYTLELDEPPGDRDLVDYFLFDLQRGYCDYYASAMVVLARAAGIPARLAVGYVGGSYDPSSNRYLISAAEAHSWPELYFPSYGWIGFEPTAGRPALGRSEQVASLESPQWRGERANFTWGMDWRRLGMVILVVLGILLLSRLFWAVAETWRLQRLPARLALAHIYRRMYRSGKRLEIPTVPGNTPSEIGRLLIHRLEQVAPAAGEISPAGRQIQALADAYARQIYGSQLLEENDRQQAIQDWRIVRRQLWLARLAKLAARFRG